MSKIVWDQKGKHYWEAGVKFGVLYPMKDDGTYDKGVAWDGLTSISMNPDGADPNELWADNIKYAVLRSAETLSLTIEAYQYPPEFEPCDGLGVVEGASGLVVGQQERQSFGLCYRTEVGNDTNAKADDSYKLHLIYGCTAQPSDKDYETINDSPDAMTFSWEVDTLPENVEGTTMLPVSEIVVDSRRADAEKLAVLEGYLYGKDAQEAHGSVGDDDYTPAVAASDPTLLTPAQVIKILKDGTL